RKLSLEYKRPQEFSDLSIAPHLLIPFVENAFKHGPAKEEGISWIKICIELEQNQLKFTCKNSFNDSQMNEKIHSGIGLSNVRKRLELLYPNQYQLDLKKEEYFEIHFQLNLIGAA
ncbi:MAG: histidine kinase, partial [Bacteroidota bacterium]